ncbi:hypothetical protein DL766_003080 [Monosporascus sp. MC13-8B]|uniref:Calcium uniporter protein, mitochondrial n=1 Tax=Monosporascus cannonballus TaxID=155416 RepID=A0ABY0GRB7_9PEZI|nr:hypothetical protein DL762_010153 [Monosporascus cannonballus]RYP34263.1 hypothetical protein DL766_003080 [Monosporascus sp. MC13-8B]
MLPTTPLSTVEILSSSDELCFSDMLKADSVKVATASRKPLPVIYHRSARSISTAARLWSDGNYHDGEETAGQTNQRDQDAQEEQVKLDISEAAKQRIKRPWQREGADEPPVSQERKNMNKSMAKGKLLTTPTRLLKLVLPLPVDALHDERGNKGEFRAIAQNEDIQPLALLVHSQQPLSYLERLIQAELPPVRDADGREKVPNLYFLAEGSERDEGGQKLSGSDRTHVDDSYTGKGHEGAETPAEHKDWVRWSSSTEIGDFIRDAARGREFAIHIDGIGAEIRVGVPSFNDRTHYMRMGLRRMSHKINSLAKLKHECDMLAHRGPHRVAKAGFGVLTAWWATVYFVTFHRDAGWDLVEPVTKLTTITDLAGLTTIMGGYLWFLFISRDLSYQAALKITVSRRQNILYQARGFDPQQWEALVHDANALRREIRTIAEEYDVDWDEMSDLGGEDVVEVLEKEEQREKKGRSNTVDDEEDDGGDRRGRKEPKDKWRGGRERASERDFRGEC